MWKFNIQSRYNHLFQYRGHAKHQSRYDQIHNGHSYSIPRHDVTLEHQTIVTSNRTAVNFFPVHCLFRQHDLFGEDFILGRTVNCPTGHLSLNGTSSPPGIWMDLRPGSKPRTNQNWCSDLAILDTLVGP